MKTEKVILSFIAILFGLLVAGGGFYLYQITKSIPDPKGPGITKASPTPTPDRNNFLVVNEPKEESVMDKKTITISGQTSPAAVITISTEINDEVVTPTKTGTFSTTQTLDDGVNIIKITAMFPNGEEQSVTRMVTYETEEF